MKRQLNYIALYLMTLLVSWPMGTFNVQAQLKETIKNAYIKNKFEGLNLERNATLEQVDEVLVHLNSISKNKKMNDFFKFSDMLQFLELAKKHKVQSIKLDKVLAKYGVSKVYDLVSGATKKDLDESSLFFTGRLPLTAKDLKNIKALAEKFYAYPEILKFLAEYESLNFVMMTPTAPPVSAVGVAYFDPSNPNVAYVVYPPTAPYTAEELASYPVASVVGAFPCPPPAATAPTQKEVDSLYEDAVAAASVAVAPVLATVTAATATAPTAVPALASMTPDELRNYLLQVIDQLSFIVQKI